MTAWEQTGICESAAVSRSKSLQLANAEFSVDCRRKKSLIGNRLLRGRFGRTQIATIADRARFSPVSGQNKLRFRSSFTVRIFGISDSIVFQSRKERPCNSVDVIHLAGWLLSVLCTRCRPDHSLSATISFF
jgi:hypothetical protein